MTKEELLIVADAAGIGKKKSTYGCSWNDLRRFAQMVKKRDMVKLTDKEVHQILDDNLEGGSLVDICRAIEAAVIRKNT
jgi:pyruvate/2-oxoglutarate dehydrogenase complex dihydrolipoamide acyltransferase (E2) component